MRKPISELSNKDTVLLEYWVRFPARSDNDSVLLDATGKLTWSLFLANLRDGETFFFNFERLFSHVGNSKQILLRVTSWGGMINEWLNTRFLWA